MMKSKYRGRLMGEASEMLREFTNPTFGFFDLAQSLVG
jgi:hypothetical protein